MIKLGAFLSLAFIALPSWLSAKAGVPVQAIGFDEITVGGELKTRIDKNLSRLEEEKYQPDHVFLTEEQSGGWPGDTEGRTILGLVLDAQTAHRAPRYLAEILNRLPAHLNKKGYMGSIYPNEVNEQQLSGNGWMLRGLCEYYLWTKDKRALQWIHSFADNLFMTAAPFYASYPLLPNERKKNVGAESGSIQNTVNHWMLSSDIGCVFIGMEGFIQAYQVLREPAMRPVIENMIRKFLEMKLVDMKAQTHATLTACRGLIRFADITGDKKYVMEAEKRYDIYRSAGLTANFENYNWFNRFDTWTEPCAIVDSYMLAMQLWQHTGKTIYLEDAEHIYYNALCHTQRYNGGFGCDNCPGKAIQTPFLKVHADEAHWCCTMRGGEGLSRVAEYSCFKQNRTVFITSFHDAKFSLRLGNKQLSMEEQTGYPFDGNVQLIIRHNTAGQVDLRIFMPSWGNNYTLTVNGKIEKIIRIGDFASLKRIFKTGDVVKLNFNEVLGYSKSIDVNLTDYYQLRPYYGPLYLGVESKDAVHLSPNDFEHLEKTSSAEFSIKSKNIVFTPIYHLMDAKVWSGTGYQKQIIF